MPVTNPPAGASLGRGWPAALNGPVSDDELAEYQWQECNHVPRSLSLSWNQRNPDETLVALAGSGPAEITVQAGANGRP